MTRPGHEGTCQYSDVPTPAPGSATLTRFDAAAGASCRVVEMKDVPHRRKMPRRPALKNHLLLQMPADARASLLADAPYTDLPAGTAFARVGDAIAATYFPDAGLLSLISEMTTGHHVAITAVGAEGMIGFGTLLGLRHYAYSPITLVASSGHLVRTDRLLHSFNASETVRRIFLSYIGGRLADVASAAACNRVHSHRQRLARWLLVATDRSGEGSLPVTHDALAQMVGGPRHAVTAALKKLRTRGAIAHRRGRVEVLRRSVLEDEACECYAAAYRTVPTGS